VNSFDATLNVKQGFPVFSTHVEANHIQKTEDVYAAYKLTDEDIRSIHKLAADKRIGGPLLIYSTI
jgi:DNA replication licensing factor MCM2